MGRKESKQTNKTSKEVIKTFSLDKLIVDSKTPSRQLFNKGDNTDNSPIQVHLNSNADKKYIFKFNVLLERSKSSK